MTLILLMVLSHRSLASSSAICADSSGPLLQKVPKPPLQPGTSVGGGGRERGGDGKSGGRLRERGARSELDGRVCPVVSSSLTGSTPGTADHSLAPGKSSRNRAQGSPSALTSSEPRLPPWPEPPRISLCFPRGQRGSGPGLPGLHLTPCGRQDGDRRRAAGPPPCPGWRG